MYLDKMLYFQSHWLTGLDCSRNLGIHLHSIVNILLRTSYRAWNFSRAISSSTPNDSCLLTRLFAIQICRSPACCSPVKRLLTSLCSSPGSRPMTTYCKMERGGHLLQSPDGCGVGVRLRLPDLPLIHEVEDQIDHLSSLHCILHTDQNERTSSLASSPSALKTPKPGPMIYNETASQSGWQN